MSIITSQINNQINDLQSVASSLADYDPDGDRTLEEGLKPFLISACIGMVEKATMMRPDREAMMQYILDQTDLGLAIPYDAKTIYRKLQSRNSDAYQTLYGMANGWDLPGYTVSWIVYTVMAVNFGREDIAENFLPAVSNLMKSMGDLLMKPFPHVPANRAFYLYMKETIEHFNQEMRDQFGLEEDVFTSEIEYEDIDESIYEEEQEMCEEYSYDDEALEMEETLDDFIIANNENPFDLDTRLDAISDPFGFADDED